MSSGSMRPYLARHATPLTLAGLVTVVGIALPGWLGYRLAVTQSALLPPVPVEQGVAEMRLGTASSGGLAVAPRKIAALPVAPNSLDTLLGVFERYDYRLATLREGARGVPPIFVETFPADWSSLKGGDRRKRLFVKTVLPLILKANAEIRFERRQLLVIESDAGGDLAAVPPAARDWLDGLAARYGLEAPDFAALKRRVDEIPVSLALAQAANESGWGTSRFAREGNALFGQWTWNPAEGMRPKEMRAEKGSYAVKKFDTLGQSVAGYMANLNRHGAYAPLRERRAARRAAGQPISGSALAAGLIKYSERGQDYIDEIRAMIQHNKFQDFDEAALGSAALG